VLTAGDAVATGLVASLAHRGGNITGSTFFFPELMAKRVELLKEVVPSTTQAAVLLEPNNPSDGPILHAVEITARALKVSLQTFETRGPSDFEITFSAIAKMLAAIAEKQHLASVGFLEFTAAGGLTESTFAICIAAARISWTARITKSMGSSCAFRIARAFRRSS
jgi:putative ABC transport system substrate-binding protein